MLHRFEVAATVGADRTEGVLSGAALRLVTLRLTDGGPVADAATGREHVRPDVEALLRPDEARGLAFELLVLAEHAERVSERRSW